MADHDSLGWRQGPKLVSVVHPNILFAPVFRPNMGGQPYVLDLKMVLVHLLYLNTTSHNFMPNFKYAQFETCKRLHIWASTAQTVAARWDIPHWKMFAFTFAQIFKKFREGYCRKTHFFDYLRAHFGALYRWLLPITIYAKVK